MKAKFVKESYEAVIKRTKPRKDWSEIDAEKEKAELEAKEEAEWWRRGDLVKENKSRQRKIKK